MSDPALDDGDEAFVATYLQRLGVERRGLSDLAQLCALQRAHLTTVPFENLSVHLGEPISLDPAALATKILTRRRGGFCYELNGLFARLLDALGYDVTLLGARVWDGHTFGPPLDHMVLVVATAGEGGPWIVDVGFGDHSLYPVPWHERVEHSDPCGMFWLEPTGDGDWDLYRNGSVQYRIEPHARCLADFEAMCWYQQNSPLSHFTRSLVCTRCTETGRVTLSGRRLITTTADGRHESEIDADQDLLDAYRDLFGIELDRTPVLRPLPAAATARRASLYRNGNIAS